MMMSLAQTLDAAVQHHRAGQLAEADALYGEILAVNAHHFDALHLRGVAAHQTGRQDLAVKLISQALAIEPANAAAHFNLGEVYRTLGRSDEAVSEYRRALELKPDFAEAHNNLGNELKNCGQIDEAIAEFHRAIEMRPSYAVAHFNLGNTLREQGCLDDAARAYHRTLKLDASYLKAYLNLGSLYREQRRLPEAATAYAGALKIQPDCVEACNNLGITRVELWEFDEAISLYRHGLRVEPKHAVLHLNLGIALNEKGRLDEAIAAIRRALEIQPDLPDAHSNLAAMLCKQGLIEDAVAVYRRALELRPEDAGVHSSLIFTLQLLPACDPLMIEEEQRRWDRQFGEPARRLAQSHRNLRNAERRLRIGYVSADFRAHVAGFNVLPLFRLHDQQCFEVYGYSAFPRPDALTEEFRRHSQQWREINGMTDEALAAKIREDGVDILVDLTLHSAGNRLPVFGRRPAPVQVSFAAYPGGTGLEAIKYRLSDGYLERTISEQVFLLESFWCYRECAVQVNVNDLPARGCGYVTFGSFSNFSKVNDRVLKLWARVLKRVAGSRLICLCGAVGQRQRTMQILAREGTKSDRVSLIDPQPHGEYLKLYHQVDIVLDTFPYNGHTTSLDALWMGVPVVSFAGDTQVSRGGLSILSNLGLPDLVANSEEQYVEIAAALAADHPRLAKLRTSLRGQMEASVFLDAVKWVRNIEAAYRAMWRQWCAEPSGQ